jgi:tRNA threonylcarbamoyladenosine biosynthesis protein TsaE
VKREFISRSPAATTSLGRRVGERLAAGSLIALIGELGCGKTLLTRGICTGLGVPPRQVNSPTFVLVNEYEGRLPVFHLDMYQLGNAPDAVELGIMDYVVRARAGVMIIEWAERIEPVLPAGILKIKFDIISRRERHIVLATDSEMYSDILKGIRQS